MQIKIKDNIKEFKKGLDKVAKQKLPQITRSAVNNTLFGLRKEMMKQFYLSAKKMSEFSSIHYKIYG